MELASMLRALGDPTRYTIFCTLLERRCCVRSLSRELGITEPAVSQHLKKLKEAELIYGERFGRHMHYSPRREALDYLEMAFAQFKQKSTMLERTAAPCRCAYRRGGHEHSS